MCDPAREVAYMRRLPKLKWLSSRFFARESDTSEACLARAAICGPKGNPFEPRTESVDGEPFHLGRFRSTWPNPSWQLQDGARGASNPHPLVFVERDFIGVAIVQFRGARRGMVRHRLGVFEGSGVFQIIRTYRWRGGSDCRPWF